MNKIKDTIFKGVSKVTGVVNSFVYSSETKTRAVRVLTSTGAKVVYAGLAVKVLGHNSSFISGMGKMIISGGALYAFAEEVLTREAEKGGLNEEESNDIKDGGEEA